MRIIILAMLLAGVELPQLPLLLWKKHACKSCAGVAAAAVVVRHDVPDDEMCCCGILYVIPFFFFRRDLFGCLPWQCCGMYGLDLPINSILIIRAMHPRTLRVCAEPRRAAARRGEASLVFTTIYLV